MSVGNGKRSWGKLLCAVSVCALASGVFGANRALEAYRSPGVASGDVGPLPDGNALRVLSVGFDRLLADLFWLRTVYYVGDERSTAAGYPALNRLSNLVTDIDPKFQTVYVTMSGAIGGLKGDPEGAIALLEKGTRHVEYWKLHFLLGFSYFMERQDYERAARELTRAYEIGAGNGAPPYLPLLAARLYANAGESETALAFIQARLSQEQHPETRKSLEKRYWDLWIARDLQRIDAAIARYRERSAESPHLIEDLVRAGLLDAEPRDPRGGRYRIAEGAAVSDLPYDKLQMHRAHRVEPAQVEREYEALKRAQEGKP